MCTLTIEYERRDFQAITRKSAAPSFLGIGGHCGQKTSKRALGEARMEAKSFLRALRIAFCTVKALSVPLRHLQQCSGFNAKD